MCTTIPKRFKTAEVDALEVLSLVDNTVDFLSTVERKEVQPFRQWTKKRHGQEWTKTHSRLPLAEHGFSVLVRVLQGKKSTSILFDTGCSSRGVIDNAERMGIDLKEVGFIVLSHGHNDHSGGLLSTLKEINITGLPIILHEDMFKTRGTVNDDGTIRIYPKFPSERQMINAKLIKTKQPLLLANDSVLVTGEIPRETSFEKGYLKQKTLINGSWQSDPWIWDDRALVITVKEKGLVIISGCAHAGIINTVNYAQQITGITETYAVIGGFHLAGKEVESRIKRSVKELRRINPKLVIPSHCTGWRATCAIATALPNAFAWNSVGNMHQI